MPQSEAIIQAAQRIRDWPSLEKAVDEMMADQAENVAWWKNTVTPNKVRKSVSAVQGTQIVPMAEAEELIGFRNQTISKWQRRRFSTQPSMARP